MQSPGTRSCCSASRCSYTTYRPAKYIINIYCTSKIGKMMWSKWASTEWSQTGNDWSAQETALWCKSLSVCFLIFIWERGFFYCVSAEKFNSYVHIAETISAAHIHNCMKTHTTPPYYTHQIVEMQFLLHSIKFQFHKSLCAWVTVFTEGLQPPPPTHTHTYTQMGVWLLIWSTTQCAYRCSLWDVPSL